MQWLGQHLALFLFLVLAIALFSGYPVAFVLGGIAIFFGALGMLLDVFHPAVTIAPEHVRCGQPRLEPV